MNTHSLSRTDKEAIDSAVLSALYPRLHRYSDLDVWLSHNYDPAYWGERLDGASLEIKRIREWASTLPDPAVRSAYIGWLDYYDGGIAEAWREVKTQKTRREQEVFRNRTRCLRERSLACQVPKPPAS